MDAKTRVRALARWGCAVAWGLTSACDGGGRTGGGVVEGTGGAGAGESLTPAPGRFEGEVVSFRVTDDGRLVDLDLRLACTCDGEPHALDGRVREGGALSDDGRTLVPVVNSEAGLRVEGAFTGPDSAEGRYDFRCCRGVAWQSFRAAPSADAGIAGDGICRGSPAASRVPLGRTETGAALHWTEPARCIALSVAPALGDRRAFIEGAAAAWTLVGCSELCFEPVGEATEAPADAADRRIHVQTADDEHPVPAGAAAATRVRVRPLDGEITGATIVLGDTALASAASGDPTELLRQFGRALGFEQAPEGVDSVLAAGGMANRPTAADEQALCAVYGTPPFCGE
jgi:hypothetical protein